MKSALALLREIQLHPPDRPSGDGGPTAVTASASEMPAIGAVLIRSDKFGRVWLALDPITADEIRAEEEQRDEPCPVLAGEDVVSLGNMSERAIRAALAVIAAFPGTEIVH